MSERPSYRPGSSDRKPDDDGWDRDPRRYGEEREWPDPLELPPSVRWGCDDLHRSRDRTVDCPEQYDYLYRAGQLLVHRDDRERLPESFRLLPEGLGRGIRVIGDCPAAIRDFLLVRVPRGVLIARVVDELRKLELRVGPNIVYHGASHIGVTPSAPPKEADPLQPLDPLVDPPEATVAVIDTGVDLTDPFFNGHCVGDAELPPAAGTTMASYCGHGTFVAATILDLLRRRKVRVRSYAPMGADGFCDDQELAQELSDLMTNPMTSPVRVINISAGGQILDSEMNQTILQLRQLLSQDPDLLIVASAGNDASNLAFYPAALAEVIGVAATRSRPADPNNPRLACFSNYGNWVNACAVGVDRHSSFLQYTGKITLFDGHGNCPRLSPDNGQRNFQRGAQWSGTSFAAPVVTAKVIERRLGGETGAQIRNSYPAGANNGAGIFVEG